MRLLVYTLSLLCCTVSFSQAIKWEKSYGGTATDYATAIKKTFDGGLVVAGYTGSPNDGDVTGRTTGDDWWIVKLRPDSTLEWQKCINNSTATNDRAYAVDQTKDSGFIVAGHFASDYGVSRLDKNGNILWTRTYGGSNIDIAYGVKQASDGGYIVVGKTQSNDYDVEGLNHQAGANDFWLLKLKENGDISWSKCFGGTYGEVAYGVCENYKHGFVVVGSAQSSDGDVGTNQGSTSGFIVTVDSLGNKDLSGLHAWGGSAGDYFNAISPAPDGGFYLAGGSNSYTTNSDLDFWVVKIDKYSNFEWEKRYGGTSDDDAYCVQATADGGCIAAGHSSSNDGDVTGNSGSDQWVVKISATGDLQWQKSLGGSFSEDWARGIEETAPGTYIVGGTAGAASGDITYNHGGNDFWVVAIGPNTTYTFIGNGNWDVPANWAGGLVPPSSLSGYAEIIIYPMGAGQCILTKEQTLNQGALIYIPPGKKLIVPALSVQ